VSWEARTLEALTRPGPVSIPRFDKAQDDRLPESAWPQLDGPTDVVLVGALWIGLPPLDEASLRAPINTLEAVEDPHAVWRGHANRALAESYPALFARCELLVGASASEKSNSTRCLASLPSEPTPIFAGFMSR